MNRRRNVLWPQMVVRHVARQGMMGKVVFRWGWPYATWTVGCFLIVFSLGFKASNGKKIEEWYHQTFQVLQVRYLKFFVMLQWQYSVLVEMATWGSSLLIRATVRGMYFQIHRRHGIFTWHAVYIIYRYITMYVFGNTYVTCISLYHEKEIVEAFPPTHHEDVFFWLRNKELSIQGSWFSITFKGNDVVFFSHYLTDDLGSFFYVHWIPEMLLIAFPKV